VCYDETAPYTDILGLDAAIANASESAIATLQHHASRTGNGNPDHHAFDHPGRHGYFRDLTDDELSLASDSQPIVITAPRLSSTFDTLNMLRWSVDGYDYYGGSSSQPDPPCWWGMTEQEKTDSLVDEEAAEVLRLILSQANQRMEYGSAIYIDDAGFMQHTPLMPSSDFRTQLNLSDVPRNADGTTDFTRIVSVVHSHPQFLPNADGSPGYTNYYSSDIPDRLLYPSDRDDIQDDWDYYDWMTTQIFLDGGDPSQFSMFIAGYNGSTLELNQYFGDDEHTTTAQSGDRVDQNYTSPLNVC
jgi:hypothetical protein